MQTSVPYPGSTSQRKPFNDCAGYIASRKSGSNGIGWVVIYDAERAGLDATDGRYAVVCEGHGAIANTRNMPLARTAMKDPGSFCADCAACRIDS